MGFKIRVKTDNPGSASDTFVFPLQSGTINCTIDWGDGNQDTITSNTDPALTHQYTAPGEYDVEIISGTWTAPFFNNVGDKEKVIELKEYGTEYGSNWADAFRGCTNMDATATGIFGIGILTLSNTFYNCPGLTNLDVSNWDVSQVGSLNATFYNCTGLTALDVSNWDVSNVTSLQSTFQNCTGLTALDVSNWDVSNVTSLQNTFFNCPGLTVLDVSNWDVSKVLTLQGIFQSCLGLTTLDVSNWDVGLVTNATNMFSNSGFNDASYDALLNGWSKLILQNGVPFHAGTAKYALAAERFVLTDTFSWSITDGGPQDLDYLVDGFLWYAADDNIYLSDGTTVTNLLNVAPTKVGIAYGDGQMRLTVDGVNSAEVPYDASLLIGVLDIFRGASAMRKMRKLQRWDGTYADAKAKIDELM